MKQISFQNVFTPLAAPEAGRVGSAEQAQTADGRVWAFVKATTALSQYHVASRPANTTVTSVASSANARGQNVFVKKASAGWTAGAYQDSWILVNTGTGTGQVAKVKDNTSDTLELYEDYALTTALTVAGASGIAIVNDNAVQPVPITSTITPVVGVAQAAFTINYYGYILKRGIGGVLAGAVITVNENCTPGDSTAGQVILGVTAKGPYDAVNVGRCLVANSGANLAALVDVGAA